MKIPFWTNYKDEKAIKATKETAKQKEDDRRWNQRRKEIIEQLKILAPELHFYIWDIYGVYTDKDDGTFSFGYDGLIELPKSSIDANCRKEET